MKILGISGTLVGSKPALIVQQLLELTEQQLPSASYAFIDAKNYDLQFCDGRPTEAYNEDTQRFIAEVEQADAYIIGTTILHGTMPGVLKNIFELVPMKSFENKVVLFAANGGNELHYLAVENYIKPVANYLNMYTLPQYAFVLSNEFEGQKIEANKYEQLKKLAEQYASFASKLLPIKEEVK